MMSREISIYTNGENCWPDLSEKRYVVGEIVSIAKLKNGTESGESSVTFRIELANGKTVLAQITFASMIAATLALKSSE